MFCKRLVSGIGATIVFVVAGHARAQFEISWHTVDGGGVMSSTDGQPGGLVLSATSGQHDAQVPPVMSGGTFELTGGFWAVSMVCGCPGDMNADGHKDGRDVQEFTSCMISGGSCTCADMDGNNVVNTSDVVLYVADLLAGTTCP